MVASIVSCIHMPTKWGYTHVRIVRLVNMALEANFIQMPTHVLIVQRVSIIQRRVNLVPNVQPANIKIRGVKVVVKIAQLDTTIPVQEIPVVLEVVVKSCPVVVWATIAHVIVTEVYPTEDVLAFPTMGCTSGRIMTVALIMFLETVPRVEKTGSGLHKLLNLHRVRIVGMHLVGPPGVGPNRIPMVTVVTRHVTIVVVLYVEHGIYSVQMYIIALGCGGRVGPHGDQLVDGYWTRPGVVNYPDRL